MRLLRLFFLLPFLFAIASGTEPFPRAEQFGSREALLEAYAEILQPMGFDYRQVGSVLEGLALAKFQAEHYPEPDYRILSGVQYFERGGRTIGELDLVVWSEREQRVIEVYEVKLSGNLDRAGAQAEMQIKRFQHTLRQRKIDRMTTKVGAKRDLTARDFNGQVVYGVIGGSGAAQAGFGMRLRVSPSFSRKLAEDYSVALVGSPNRKTLWLLARDPNLPEETVHRYLQVARQQGYALDEIDSALERLPLPQCRAFSKRRARSRDHNNHTQEQHEARRNEFLRRVVHLKVHGDSTQHQRSKHCSRREHQGGQGDSDKQGDCGGHFDNSNHINRPRRQTVGFKFLFQVRRLPPAIRSRLVES